jgi:hypothetical protein
MSMSKQSMSKQQRASAQEQASAQAKGALTARKRELEQEGLSEQGRARKRGLESKKEGGRRRGGA